MAPAQGRGGRPAEGEPVLDRAFRVLDAFSGDESALRLRDLSERAELPMSTAFRLAQRLVRLGALERWPDGSYTIGVRMLTYAALAPRGHGLRAIALPYMEDLHRATGQHVQFAVREGSDGVIVERLSAKGAGKLLYHAGARIPLHGTSAGIVLLAHARPAFVNAYLQRPMTLEPEGIVLDPAEVRERLARIRAQGYGEMKRLLPEPAESVAAPVFDRTGVCIAALSVVGADGSVEMRMAQSAVVAIAGVITRDVGRSPNLPDR
ncbi:MAG: IclR family transcriptional regulator [Gordonia sp. (in: high G+C Gram-positive bacteria)]